MKDVITISSPSGSPVDDYGRKVNDYGRPSYTKTSSKARVKHTTDVDLEVDGEVIKNVLIIKIPPETKVEEGYQVEWVDRFGKVTKGSIEGIQETLNYGGDKVYYRTIYVNKSPRLN